MIRLALCGSAACNMATSGSADNTFWSIIRDDVPELPLTTATSGTSRPACCVWSSQRETSNGRDPQT
jgi:hypothetical protein